MIKTLEYKEFIKECKKRELLFSSDKEKDVFDIIQNIGKNGDKALFDYCKKFDYPDVEIDTIFLNEKAIQSGAYAVADEIKAFIDKAYDNITLYHSKQVTPGTLYMRGSSLLGQIVRPLDKVGIYVPGGKGIYPSTLLMNAIPAKLAGVPEIYVASPPNDKGELDLSILYAAKLCGVKAIYRMGGAHAVASFALGTETVPKVDKITGPGNIYVTLAKRMLFGRVGIDMLAGPSEVLILADSSSNSDYIARDFLAQSEHDEDASSVVLVDSKEKAKEIDEKIETMISKSKRSKILKKSAADNGRIVIYKNLDQAYKCINEYAPEHLEVLINLPLQDIISQVRNAGSICIGEYTPVPVGDYFAGSNHSLPTSGTARFASPLSVYDFVKRSSVICYGKETYKEEQKLMARFAEYEGFIEHSNSIKSRK